MVFGHGPILGGASGASHGPAGAQVLVQVSPQMPTALDVQRPVDHLRTHPHLRPVRKRCAQVVADMLRAPLHAQLVVQRIGQLGVLKLTHLRPPARNSARFCAYLDCLLAPGAGPLRATFG